MLANFVQVWGNFFENPKVFVWARRMQFWQPCRNIFWSLFEKSFFWKKNWFSFQNRLMWLVCCRMRIKWFYFLKMSFHLNCYFFRKLKIFELIKITKFDEGRVLFIWCFHLSKGIYSKIGGGKYAGTSRPSCLSSSHDFLKNLLICNICKKQFIFVCCRLFNMHVSGVAREIHVFSVVEAGVILQSGILSDPFTTNTSS